MIKQAPSLGRIARDGRVRALVLRRSCCACGSSSAGRSRSSRRATRSRSAFPEAVGLTKDVDVRAAGHHDRHGARRRGRRAQRGRALATLELESRLRAAGQRRAGDPAPQDAARRDLRGDRARARASAPKIADGGRLDDARVAETVELDEIFQTYDPTTRRAFQLWQRELGTALGERGESLNNALGQLPEFAESGADLLGVLDEQESAVRGLVRDTGEVYSAPQPGRAPAAQPDHGLARGVPPDRRRAREAGRGVPASSPRSCSSRRLTLERLEGFSREHAAARARPAPGGARAAADAACRCARSRPTSSASSWDGIDTACAGAHRDRSPAGGHALRGRSTHRCTPVESQACGFARACARR